MCTLSVYIAESMEEDISDLGEAELEENLSKRAWRPLIVDIEDEIVQVGRS